MVHGEEEAQKQKMQMPFVSKDSATMPTTEIAGTILLTGPSVL